MVVTSARGWLALVALGIVLTAAVLWGFFGSVQTRVRAEGIVLLKAMIFSISAGSSGKIESLAVMPGQMVEKGQTIAVIHSASSQAKIRDLASRLEEHQRKYQRDLEEEKESFRTFQALLEVQRRNLQTKLDLLMQREKSQEELYKEQLIRRQELQATRIEILAAKEEVKKIAAQEKQRQTALNQFVVSNETEIRLLERALVSAQKEDLELRVIISPYSGRVLSVECKKGDLIETGRILAVLQRQEPGENSSYDVLAYVSGYEGKHITRGMEVQVVPSTVKAEEYGVMLGKVTSISDYPVSNQAIQSVVENPNIVQNFLKIGSPFEVWIDLQEDPKTPSGFRWSSSKGPPYGIGFGTMCTVQVVVRRQTPASLVIPWLRTLVSGRERTGGK
jgi:HlyD family secretion protein